MRESLHRYLGLASVLLLAAATFAACGGLDPRKVSRGPRFEDGGEPGSNAGSPPVSSGGSNAQGGDPGNPFGGQLFTGGAPPVLEGPPEVVQVDPADGAVEVELSTNVSLLFSEALDAATVTEDSVQVLDGDAPVAGEVSLDDQDGILATFNPTRALALACTYNVSVSTAVTDRGGAALGQAFSSSFTTRDGAWDVTDTPFVGDPNNWGLYSEAFLAVDGRGNALVVWPEYDANTGQYAFWGRWHRATTGWQDGVQLSTGEINGFSPRAGVAANESGDAVVVWSEYDSMTSQYQVMARRFTGGAWSAAPEPIQGDLMITQGIYTGPQVKMSGDRIVVWWVYTYQSGSYYYDYLYSQSTTVDGGWDPSPQYVGSTSSTENINAGTLALDSAGNGMLVYTLNSAAGYSLYFAKHVGATQAWEQAAPIPNATNVTYDAPAVALDEAGAAMVAWRNGGTGNDLTASRYTKAKGFAMPATLDELDTAPQLSYSNPIATDGTNFFISWVQTVGSTGNVYGARYDTAGGAWSAATLLSDGDTGVNYASSTVADPHGNGMAIWLQGDAVYTNNMYDYSAVEFKYARFSAAEGDWLAPQVIAGNKPYDQYRGHRSAVAQNGIVAVLNYTDGHNDSMNMYVPGQPLVSVFR